MTKPSVTKFTEGLQLTREEIENVINFLHSKINASEINDTLYGSEKSKDGEVDYLNQNQGSGGIGVCEIIIILGIFGIWFYSIGRIYVVWRNILNFSTEQPSSLSWNSLLIYIRNLKKSGSNEVVKENSSDKNSARPFEVITKGESGPLQLR